MWLGVWKGHHGWDGDPASLEELPRLEDGVCMLGRNQEGVEQGGGRDVLCFLSREGRRPAAL